MPEINLQLKIKGGKRTETQVTCTTKSGEKTISFKNGITISEKELMDHIEKEMLIFIGTT